MKRGMSRLRKKEERAGYLFILPWLIGFIVFVGGSMIYSFGLSFYKFDMLTSAKFVGLENYRNLFSLDQDVSLFWKTLFNTSYYTLFSVFLGITASLIIALLLNCKIKGLSLYRTIYYLPAVISGVAVYLLWAWMFDPNSGVINYVLSRLGLPQPKWIFSEGWAKPAMIIMSLWGVGAWMLVYLAGLQGIPTQLYEAAKIDGANAWQRFLKITLPMLSPTIFFTLIMGIIISFQIFDAAYIMTDGGPNNATMFFMVYLYRQAFTQLRMGFSSALAWVYFLIMVSLALLIFKSSSVWVYYESETKGR